ncbi:MAG TPA: serine/threonine-protein kinase [Polyangiaceae bacterium]|jgi:serine/threonine-protein kinase|nr:serine/threonine-protein kinase [Polyangiaceae bacterium]
MAPAAPTAEDERIGTRLAGRYELRRVVADGGMGRVYEGIDKQTDSRIAVKMLHADVARDEVALERFKREYEINAKLPHEHIVKVLGFERDPISQMWILIMEFLDGEELRYVLKREKTLPPERLVRMLSQVAIGLDEAHGRGFIHRDLKPDNLFLCGTREGDIVKLLDFGSVKDTATSNQKKLTVLGTTIGSPYYMAPEQAQGLETIDSRADVFALAAVVYECITGEVPFGGTNGPSILLAILTKDAEPPTSKASKVKHPIPPAMDEVLEVALTKNPAIRTKSVGALADAVGAAYGLTGDHRQWALVPQQDLAATIAEAMPRIMAAKVAPLGVAGDPFAAGNVVGDPFAAPGAGAMPVGDLTTAPRTLGAPDSSDFRPQGVPGGKPGWMLPVIVGVLALLVGGAVTLFVMMGR